MKDWIVRIFATGNVYVRAIASTAFVGGLHRFTLTKRGNAYEHAKQCCDELVSQPTPIKATLKAPINLAVVQHNGRQTVASFLKDTLS